jgi:hypothetical protein
LVNHAGAMSVPPCFPRLEESGPGHESHHQNRKVKLNPRSRELFSPAEPRLFENHHLQPDMRQREPGGARVLVKCAGLQKIEQWRIG